jgi:hypothetical protein
MDLDLRDFQKPLTVSIDARRPIPTRKIGAVHLLQHIALWPIIVVRAHTRKLRHQVRTLATIVARIAQALVDLQLAQSPLKSGLAQAREVRNPIQTRRVVHAIGGQAFVDVLRTIVQFEAGRTFACVLFAWIAAGASILAVLFEAQDATLVRFAGVELEMVADRTVLVDVGVREEGQQVAAHARLAEAALEGFSVVDAWKWVGK